MVSRTARAFCLTLNNPEESFCIDLFDEDELPHLIYFVYQLEIGKSGTLHVQAYCEFDSPVRASSIVKYFVSLGYNDPHVEPRKGTRDQARSYCMSSEYAGEDKG